MNAKSVMTVEEVKDFFANTLEFKVEEEGQNLRITYEDDDKKTSSLLYTPTVNIQQLIRKITQLVWNHCNDILD